jgi:FkbM family methyltransferase
MLSRIVGPTGQVIALEPNSHNVEVARQNRELNSARNLEIVRAAAADRAGTLVFNLGLNGNVDDGSGEWGRCDVACLSTDDLAAQYGVPDVIFIDVEGFEEHALKGASRTLSWNPDCFVEVHTGCGLERYGGSVSSVLSFFPKERFQLLVSAQEGGEFRALEETSRLPMERFFLIALARHRLEA